MNIFIRADGGSSIGMGHIMRMIVLASEFRKENKIFFLCKSSKDGKYKAGIDMLEKNKFKVLKINEENIIEEILYFKNKYDADILITDSYDVSEEYFHILKSKFKITGYVDDINKCFMNVDFIINQNINALDLDYSKTTNEHTKLFLGTKYCMIREEFKKACQEKIIKESVEDILLSLGGMDDDNNTVKILNDLIDLNQNIHVVLGSAFKREVIDSIYKYSYKYKNIYLYENADMSKLMKKCDIAVSACGSTIYELCAMKVPAIGIVIAENQRYISEVMKENKIILDNIDINNWNSDNFKKAINNLIEDNQLRNEIISNCKKIVNINGSEKLAKDIIDLIRNGDNFD